MNHKSFQAYVIQLGQVSKETLGSPGIWGEWGGRSWDGSTKKQ